MTDLHARLLAAIEAVEANVRAYQRSLDVGAVVLLQHPEAVLRGLAEDRDVLARHAPDNSSDPNHPTTWCVAHDHEIVWRDCPEVRSICRRHAIEVQP